MIETIYRVRIDYDFKKEGWVNRTVEQLEDKIFKLKGDISSFQGNSCCQPYFQAECQSLEDAKTFERVCKRLIRNRKTTLQLL